jgi:hypothetical protein
VDEIKKKKFVRKDALEAEAAAKRKRKRPKGYLGCILGLTIGIAGLAAARLGHLWVGFDIFSQFTPQFMCCWLPWWPATACGPITSVQIHRS